MLELKSPAPAFSLLNQDDEQRSLRDYAGKWLVLYFYPRDDTPGCTTQACEFTASIAEFRGFKTTVVGCSPDTPAKHRKFIEKHELEIELLSDPDHETLEAYEAWGEKKLYGKVSMGVIRSTVLIDPKGKVAHHWPKVSAKGHAVEVLAKLEELGVK
jgi:peroxiredoxin Q/BCP